MRWGKFGVFIVILILINSLGCATRQLGSTPDQNKKIRFLHLSDMHAQLDTHWEYLPEDPEKLHRMGGFARIKTALDSHRASAPGAVFTVDGGDTVQGSAIGAWTQGEGIISPLNALGIDVGTPGNWEVVYGPKAFRKLMGEVNYQVVCYNFHDTKTGKRIFPPATLIERNGVRVAFVGMTDPTTTTRQPPAEVEGLDSTRIEGFREFVQEFKAKHKPDLMVLVDHTGLAPSVQIAHDVPELDIVLSGHTHERVYSPIQVGKTIVVEPGSLGSFLGQLDVTINDGKIVGHHYELIAIDAEKYDEDPKMKEMISKIEAPFQSQLNHVVGKTKTTLLRYDVLEGTLDNLIADAVNEATHSEVAFTNGFRYSPPIPPGNITQKDLWNALPLDARLKTGKVTGQRLWDYLENEMELVFAKDPFVLSGGWGPRPSGLWIRFEAASPKGKRLKEVKINGKPLNKTAFYQIGGCERDGEVINMVCRLKGLKDSSIVPGTIHQAVESYLEKHSQLT